MALLRPRGRYVMLGVPPAQPTINHTGVIFKCLVLTGSLVGNLAMTQEMLDFCGEKNITSDVEVCTRHSALLRLRMSQNVSTKV
jgi:uncharacterized zinc-type alcohol dehydrogenase-like protein